jgi:hypothetical protein
VKYKDLAEVSAQYTAAHREIFKVLNDAVSLAELDKASKHSDEVQDILMTYSQVRLKLMEALLWYKQLHQSLVPRTDESKVAAAEYIEKLKAKEKNGEPPKPEEPVAPEADVEDGDKVQEGVPCLKLL